MQGLLDPREYDSFLKSYEQERHQALRVNTGKMKSDVFWALAPFHLRPVPWVKEGFYYEAADRPGKHPYHEAGLYYIQEPSAMSVAALAAAEPGERILDLCAAPGGKTTQLAAAMGGQGLLVSNEIHPARAKILAQNVERMGIPNALVTNESPASLVERFPAFFDRVIVDAPCSGEGMFRKEEQATIQWSPENVALCAERQSEILESAANMLRPGGRLVYSTCTFAPEENEGTIFAFLKKHPEFSVEAVPAYEGFDTGHPEWLPGWEEEVKEQGASGEQLQEQLQEQLRRTFRLWPHRLEGEGHFVAILKKAGSGNATCAVEKNNYSKEEKASKGGKGRRDGGTLVDKTILAAYESFAKDTLLCSLEGVPVLFGEQLYLMPEAINLKGLRVLRAGLHLGSVSKGRFEPAHALALALSKERVKRSLDFEADSPKIRAYLHGETLETEQEKGWCLILADGFPLGWGKVSGGVVKNHYPKGLRWNN